MNTNKMNTIPEHLDTLSDWESRDIEDDTHGPSGIMNIMKVPGGMVMTRFYDDMQNNCSYPASVFIPVFPDPVTFVNTTTSEDKFQEMLDENGIDRAELRKSVLEQLRDKIKTMPTVSPRGPDRYTPGQVIKEIPIGDTLFDIRVETIDNQGFPVNVTFLS